MAGGSSWEGGYTNSMTWSRAECQRVEQGSAARSPGRDGVGVASRERSRLWERSLRSDANNTVWILLDETGGWSRVRDDGEEQRPSQMSLQYECIMTR